MISKCRHISVDDKNHVFSIVQRPQRSGGQTMPLAIPRAVSGHQSRGLAAEILFRPRGRGFTRSLKTILRLCIRAPTQHYNITAPVHHHNFKTKTSTNTVLPSFQPPRSHCHHTCFFCFIIFEVVMFILLLFKTGNSIAQPKLPFSAFPTFQLV